MCRPGSEYTSASRDTSTSTGATSDSDVVLDGRWGPALPDYLDHFNQVYKDHWLVVLSSNKLLEEKAQKTIARLQNPATKPWSLLEDIFLLTLHSKYMNVLITPLCVGTVLKLFKEYEGQCSGYLFTQYVGFLSVHLIIRLLQMGMIVRSKTLEGFESLVIQSDNELNITEPLTKYAISLAEESLIVTAKEGHHWLFDHTARKTGKGAMPLGGIPFHIISIIHKRLWDERKMFSMVCTHTYLPGWAPLWFAILICLKEINPDPVERDKLMGLLYRFMLVSGDDDEMAITARLLVAVRVSGEFEKNDYYSDPIDEEDARVLVLSYIRRIQPTEGNLSDQPVRLLLSLVNTCIFESAVFSMVPHLAPACWQASVSYAWRVIKENSHLGPKENEHVIRYSQRCLFYTSPLIDKMDTKMNLYKLIETFAKGDMINLLAQSLFRLPDFEDSTKMVQAIAETAQNLINMREAFKRAEQNTVNLDVFRLGYNDWLKAYRFSLGHLPMWESPHSPLHGYDRVVRDGIRQMGETFYFEVPSSFELEPCAYSRCPDPYPTFDTKLICANCCVTRYCSKRCQHLDWVSRKSTSHRRICMSLDSDLASRRW
ncbi:unnamed protein product [Rhizoctonia solani]|uniref:MYND-type domain-containing protein n=1 Tax=Rhizoctonia solani TaxID=456999 RepID=A0A8H3D2V6_9AGAM|nr:unnamed protein product [Rhizoctonia solani]